MYKSVEHFHFLERQVLHIIGLLNTKGHTIPFLRNSMKLSVQ